MLNKGKIIVLSTLKYKDNDLIVKCYSSEHGVVSYLQKGVLKSRKGKTKAIYFQPLMLLDIEEDFRSNRSLQYLREVKCYCPYKTLHTNIYKASLALFIAEVLSNALHEEEANRGLFEFLEASFMFLDVADHFSNFHILFLMKLSRYLGFYPELRYQDRTFFNLESGIYEAEKTSIYALEAERKDLFTEFLNQDFSGVHEIRLNAEERKQLLETLLLYFELHLGNFKKPKSLQVFSEVFH